MNAAAGAPRWNKIAAAVEVTRMKWETGNVRVVLLLVLGLGLSACAAGEPRPAAMLGKTPWPPTEYRHTVSTTAIRQYWNCTRPEADVMRVKFLEWELVGVNKDGHTVSSATVESKAIQLFTFEYTTYQLDLRTTGSEVRFDLHYKYLFWDTGRDGHFVSSLDWDGPVLFAQQNTRFFVRDACSDTLHLVR
jgi:hypothetical protein